MGPAWVGDHPTDPVRKNSDAACRSSAQSSLRNSSVSSTSAVAFVAGESSSRWIRSPPVLDRKRARFCTPGHEASAQELGQPARAVALGDVDARVGAGGVIPFDGDATSGRPAAPTR